MKKIAIVTATRAEYGLLTPLIGRIFEDDELELDLIVTGTHLSEKYGNTIDEIRKDGFPIEHQIPILDDDNSPHGISATMANAITGFAKCFRDDRPDMIVILGDRTEMLGVASAAINEKIPIAHINGGEITEGAVDDSIRHALTKMSYLHFTSCELYRQRVIQLGEEPNRVFNVGALGIENVLNCEKISQTELEKSIGWELGKNYAVLTFHPVTLDQRPVELQIKVLLEAIDSFPDINFLATKSNADTGGDVINALLYQYSLSHNNLRLYDSLGKKKYLSAVKYARFVIGNSSSGIVEVPALGTPTVNLGDRQKGRVRCKGVIDCDIKAELIVESIKIALKTNLIEDDSIYGNGTTSESIVRIIKSATISDLKKTFYDR